MVWSTIKIQGVKRVKLSFFVSAMIVLLFSAHNPAYSQANPHFDLFTTLGYGTIQSLDWHDETLYILTTGGVWRYDTSNLEDDSPTLTPYQTTYSGRVLAASLGTDVEQIATQPERGRVSVETLINGEQSVVDFQTESDSISAHAISPIRNLIAVAHFSSSDIQRGSDAVFDISVWDSVTGEEVFVLPGDTDLIDGLVFSPDGAWLASSSRGGTIRLWDMMSGEQILGLQGRAPLIFSTHEPLLIFADLRLEYLYAYDLTSIASNLNGNPLIEIDRIQSSITALAISADYVAVGNRNGEISLYDSTFESIGTQRVHHDAITAIAFDDEGLRLATATETAITILDVETGSPLVEITQNFTDRLIEDMDWLNNSTVATAFGSGEVRLWDVNTSAKLCAQELPNFPYAIGIMQNDVFWVSTFANVVQLQGCDTDSIETVLDNRITIMQFNDSATQVVGIDDDWIDLYDVESRELLLRLERPSYLNTADFSPDGALLASGSGFTNPNPMSDSPADEDNSMRLWTLPDGELIGELLMDDSPVYALDFSPDGTQLASGHYSGSIQIWDVTAQTVLGTIDSASPVEKLVYSQENHLLISGHRNGEVNVWNADTLEHIQTLRQHYFSIMALEFSPNEQYLAISSFDGTTSIWTLNEE